MVNRLIFILACVIAVMTAGAQEHYDTNRGFRHPGGLHTQDDFERIKALLAAGDETVTAALNVLRTAAYAQASAATYPSETIVRGGGVGENYINAARGAAIAYQNALRWKIDGNTACAKHAVDVLMAWARTTKTVTGNSDQCLARGLYGYEFAQAAELMRDYEGWAREDFEEFCRWMLDVWYPGAIGFLRNRNGTWENVGKWWQAPGHYWSNWGLCNALCVISIGVLCDDVFIYNQGLSFIKYDQVGTFKDPRTDVPILSDGLTEFWGNLVVTTAEWDGETGAYGKVGQTNESGRDTGHAAMALGLAVDIAHQGWNQGDDLFSWMDHRIAAGIEYVAAQCQNVENLPWTNYHYYTNGYYWTDSRSWLMTAPALGAQLRPYWGTVIGHYEGVKGVRMPYSEWCAEEVGIDGGGVGATSGGYDHLGYSVLMNYRDHTATEAERPTELTPEITYGGKTYQRNDAGGLVRSLARSGQRHRRHHAGSAALGRERHGAVAMEHRRDHTQHQRGGQPLADLPRQLHQRQRRQERAMLLHRRTGRLPRSQRQTPHHRGRRDERYGQRHRVLRQERDALGDGRAGLRQLPLEHRLEELQRDAELGDGSARPRMRSRQPGRTTHHHQVSPRRA